MKPRWFLALLLWIAPHFAHADPAAFSVRAELCGEHALYPNTDIGECLRREIATESVCRTLHEMQAAYTNAWNACVRTGYRLDSVVAQYIQAREAQLRYLELMRAKCVEERGEEWCGEGVH